MTDNIATKIVDFLSELERQLPPPQNCHHGLCCEQDGLTLTIFNGKRFYPFTLDDADLAKPTADLVADIVGLMKQSAQSIPQPNNPATGNAGPSPA